MAPLKRLRTRDDLSWRRAALTSATRTWNTARQSRAARRGISWFTRAWQGLVVLFLAMVVGIVAYLNPGVDVADMRLNEGSIYVQNRQLGLVGTLNYQIDEIAAATSVGDTEANIIQEDRTVLINNRASSTLQAYDPATNMLRNPTTPPVGARISLNEQMMAVSNPENGKVWFGEASAIANSDFSGEATFDVKEFGTAVVTSEGRFLGLNVQDGVIVHDDGSTTDIPFEVDTRGNTPELSAIGNRAVLLVRQSQVLWVEGEKPVDITDGQAALLPEPMPDTRALGRGKALYATTAGLNTVERGAPASLSGAMGGTPIRPVVANDCVYGVFDVRFVKVCQGGEPEVHDIPELGAEHELVLMANRGIVVLQDILSGRVWLVDKGMKIVDDWMRVAPQSENPNSVPDTLDQRTTLPDRTKENRPPIATDDLALGARAGRSTALYVLDNDSDPDGDIITIDSVSGVSDRALVEFTGNGAGIQITLPEDARGEVEFTYTIVDGRGGSATAKARVAIISADQRASNQKPFNLREEETLVVNSGTTASKRVLLTWRDPDGDDLVLVSAAPETTDSEDEVTFTPDGLVTFRDVGKTTGLKKVVVAVSDGVSVADGYLLVDVRGREPAPPIANGDFVATMVHREVVVAPLLNDEGNNLILTEVETGIPGTEIIPNYPEGTFRFRAGRPGTYYLLYKVSNGPVSEGVIRIDVQPPTEENHPPVAVRDTAMVPFGGSVTIDPLLNDTDADNDVLVIQSISQHKAVKVVMQERHLLTISLTTRTDIPIPLTYWVSDGRNSTRGTIVVFPAPDSTHRAPKAANDYVKARAGSTLSVPVLANDVSPVGSPIEVHRLATNPFGDLAWMDRERLRIQIPADMPATTLSLTYEIIDSAGMTDSATVAVTVVSADAQNEPPIPNVVEARVLSNAVTRIPIKLAGVDPNGDSVRLLGLGSGPSLGRVVEIGDGFLRYESYPDSRGTDTFRYQVIDTHGAIGTGEVRVGVAPPSDNNSGPIGVPDEITVRPNRPVTMPVLANDYDVDGDQFGFVAENPIEADFPVEIENGFLTFTSPGSEGQYAGQYFLIDRRETSGSGTFVVNVQEDAPLQAPVAQDDQISMNAVLKEGWVTADVLANDYDLDGRRDDLTLSVPEMPGVNARVVDGKVSIEVTDHMQQVRYTITDPDGNSDQAIVLVPGLNDSVPVLVNPTEVHEVVAGELLTINLDTMVQGTKGRRVRLTSSDTVRATKGTVSVRPDGIDFQADVRYAGPASVVFEVIDQTENDDPTAKRAFITVLITVLRAESVPRTADDDETVIANRAPEGPASIELEVGAGEPEQQFGLRGRFSDPEGDNFTFQDWREISRSDGLAWSSSVGGDVINAKADVKAKGATARIHGTVVDVYGATREVTVTITVIGSTRPLPAAQADVVEDANAGQARPVPVLANDKSFLLDDQKLTLLSASVVSGDGTAKVDGDMVIVEPGKDYVGQMVVAYTIVDATEDADRHVDGVINLTVRSRPSKPGTPTIEEEGSKQVTIKWTSNSNNGLPVEKRVVLVKAENGSTSTFEDCQANTCVVTGLTNGVQYTFAVTEANELGASDESPWSAPAMPDQIPPPMKAPTLSFPGAGKPGTLVLTWEAPVYEGSPIEQYTITSSGATGQIQPIVIKDPSVTRHELTGLENGVDYAFVMTSTNKKGTSEPSQVSNTEHPSGPPPKATGVTAADLQDSNGDRIEVRWNAPDNVRDDYTFIVYAESDGSRYGRTEAGKDARSMIVQGLGARMTYRGCVVVKTRGGESGEECSSKVTTTAAPTQQAEGDISAPAAGSVEFRLRGGGDYEGAEVELRCDNGETQRASLSPDRSTTFKGLSAGQSCHVITRGFTRGPSDIKRGPAWESPPVTVYGQPSVNLNFTGYDWNNMVHLDATSYNAGLSNVTISWDTNAGSPSSGEGTGPMSIEFQLSGRSARVTARACDDDHGNNCSAGVSTIVEPPVSVKRGSGLKVKVKVNAAMLTSYMCSVDGGDAVLVTRDVETEIPLRIGGQGVVTCWNPDNDAESISGQL